MMKINDVRLAIISALNDEHGVSEATFKLFEKICEDNGWNVTDKVEYGESDLNSGELRFWLESADADQIKAE